MKLKYLLLGSIIGFAACQQPKPKEPVEKVIESPYAKGTFG
jgi:hypothetical protein